MKLAGDKGKNSPGARKNSLGFTSPPCTVPAAAISFCNYWPSILEAWEQFVAVEHPAQLLQTRESVCSIIPSIFVSLLSSTEENNWARNILYLVVLGLCSPLVCRWVNSVTLTETCKALESIKMASCRKYDLPYDISKCSPHAAKSVLIQKYYVCFYQANTETAGDLVSQMSSPDALRLSAPESSPCDKQADCGPRGVLHYCFLYESLCHWKISREINAVTEAQTIADCSELLGRLFTAALNTLS